jgi:hypothetical protein
MDLRYAIYDLRPGHEPYERRRLRWNRSKLRNEADKPQVKDKCKRWGSWGEKSGTAVWMWLMGGGLRRKREGSSQVYDFSRVVRIFHDFSAFFTLFVSRKGLIFRRLEKIAPINDTQLTMQSSKCEIEEKKKTPITRMNANYSSPESGARNAELNHGWAQINTDDEQRNTRKGLGLGSQPREQAGSLPYFRGPSGSCLDRRG